MYRVTKHSNNPALASTVLAVYCLLPIIGCGSQESTPKPNEPWSYPHYNSSSEIPTKDIIDNGFNLRTFSSGDTITKVELTYDEEVMTVTANKFYLDDLSDVDMFITIRNADAGTRTQQTKRVARWRQGEVITIDGFDSIPNWTHIDLRGDANSPRGHIKFQGGWLGGSYGDAMKKAREQLAAPK